MLSVPLAVHSAGLNLAANKESGRGYDSAFAHLQRKVRKSTDCFDACNIIWGAVVLTAGLKKREGPKLYIAEFTRNRLD